MASFPVYRAHPKGPAHAREQYDAKRAEWYDTQGRSPDPDFNPLAALSEGLPAELVAEDARKVPEPVRGLHGPEHALGQLHEEIDDFLA